MKKSFWQLLNESNFNELMNIIKTRAGWIDNNGNIHSCTPLDHVLVLEKLPEFSDLLLKDSAKKADVWDKMTKRAYDLGFVRIVINSGNVYVEGKKKFISKNREDLKDLAEMVGESSQIIPTYR